MTPDCVQVAKLALGIQRSIVDGELGLEGAALVYELLTGEPAEYRLARHARVSPDDYSIADLGYLVETLTGICALAWLGEDIGDSLGRAIAAECAA